MTWARVSRSNSDRENHSVATSIPLISQFVLQRISRFHRVSSVVSSSGSVHRCNRFRSAMAVRGWRKGVAERGKRGGRAKAFVRFSVHNTRGNTLCDGSTFIVNRTALRTCIPSHSVPTHLTHPFTPFLSSSMKNGPKAV